MGRRKTEINPVRGEHLKELLAENHITQKELAERIGYSKEHISFVVVGKRNMPEEMAKTISRYFPYARFEWLMGYDDFKTEDDKAKHDLLAERENEVKVWRAILSQQRGEEKDSVYKAFDLYLGNAGYSKKCINEFTSLDGKKYRLTDSDEIALYFQQATGSIADNQFYSLIDETDKECALINSTEFEKVVNDIAEYAEFKIKKLIEGSGSNG